MVHLSWSIPARINGKIQLPQLCVLVVEVAVSVVVVAGPLVVLSVESVLSVIVVVVVAGTLVVLSVETVLPVNVVVVVVGDGGGPLAKQS